MEGDLLDAENRVFAASSLIIGGGAGAFTANGGTFGLPGISPRSMARTCSMSSVEESVREALAPLVAGVAE